MRTLVIVLCIAVLGIPLDLAEAYDPAVPPPTLSMVRGGGCIGGSKDPVQRFIDVPALVEAGISDVAIIYRMIDHGGSGGLIDRAQDPPIRAPLHDAARRWLLEV